MPLKRRTAPAAIAWLTLLSACGTDERLPSEGALPSAPIEVIVDDNAVPHIYGQTDRDAFYGAGYMMASHRLLQMEMARRRAYGRAAEVMGNERLADDELARLFDWRSAGERAAELTRRENPDEWSVMSAWTAGVNRRIDEVQAGEAPLPFGFAELGLLPERWRDEDVLVLAKMVSFGNDLSLEFEIFVTLAEQLKPELLSKIPLPLPAHAVFSVAPEDLPQAIANKSSARRAARTESAAQRRAYSGLPAGALWRSLCALKLGASNNFAVDGRFSANGQPLLAGDPHLPFGFPGLFYALHIDSKTRGSGSYDVAGFSFPFLPGVSIGHTEALAWSPTTAFADVMDVWEVQIVGQAAIVGGVAVPISVNSEKIVVKGSGELDYEVRALPGYGVLLPSDIAPLPVAQPGHALLLAWTGFDVSGPSRLTGLNRAESLDDFEAAVDLQSGLNFNMLAADAHGISYRVGLDVPLRDPAAHPPWKVMDGSDPSALWTGEMLPRELLPRGRAPERGWIATANNDPFGFTENGRVDDDPWYYGTFFDPGWRAKRLHDELSRLVAERKLEPSDLSALGRDVHDNLADDLLPLLEQAWQNAASDPLLQPYRSDARLVTLIDVLSSWDRRLARDSSGAVVFTAFAHFAAEGVIGDDLGLLYAAVLELQKLYLLKFAVQALRGDFPNAPELLAEGRDALLLEALERTASDFLEPRFGGVDPQLYSYAELHVTKFDDALGPGFDWGETPSDGGETSVNVSPHAWVDGAALAPRWSSQMGPILRHVVSFDAEGRPRMQFNFPLGNIADPTSPHSSDLTSDWTEGNYRPMYFLREEVEAHESERLELQ